MQPHLNLHVRWGLSVLGILVLFGFLLRNKISEDFFALSYYQTSFTSIDKLLNPATNTTTTETASTTSRSSSSRTSTAVRSVKPKGTSKVPIPTKPPERAQPWSYLVPSGEKSRQDPSLFAVKAAFFQPMENRIVLSGLSDAAGLIAAKKWPYEFFCALYDSAKSLLSVVKGSFYTSYLFYCGQRKDFSTTVPAYLFVYRNDSGFTTRQKPDWMVPVDNLHKRQKALEAKNQSFTDYSQLVLCTGPFFGEQHWLLLLQFFEYYRMQGVSKFIVPQRTEFSEFTRKLLSYYRKVNLVEIDNWKVNFTFCDSSAGKAYCSQLSEKNYCILRNAYMNRYVLLCDFDELLQPVNWNLTLLEMVKARDSNPALGSFTFGARYHVTNGPYVTFEQLKKLSKSPKFSEKAFFQRNLPILAWNNFSSAIHMGYSPKTIVKPETVKKMWVHFVREHHAKYTSVNINQKTEGFFHHYKNTSKWPQVVDTYYANYKITSPLVLFEHTFLTKLLQNIHHTLRVVLEQS